MNAIEHPEAPRLHALALEVRGPWPEHDDPHPKYYVTCSCGYRATARRTELAAAEAGAAHLRRVRPKR